MNVKKLAMVLAAVGALGACGGEEEAEVGEVGTEVGEAPIVTEGVGVGEGVVEGAVFDPTLDVNGNGVLDADEGMGDADADGILDRDETYPAAM